MTVKQLIIAVFLFGAAWAQLASDQALSYVPSELQGKVDQKDIEGLQNKSTEVFKEKCQKQGGPEAYINAEKAFKDLVPCMQNLVNQTELQLEIEEAKPEGRIDEVFKKYCAKKPLFKACFKDAVEASKPCFSTSEQANLKIVYNVTEQLAEFVCFKDGDRIALFIAEGGPECFQEKQEAIQTCVNKTMGATVNFDTNNITADSIPDINFGAKECGQLTQLQECVVGSLESCAQPTTANIVESLFKFIRKATPCKDFGDTKDKARPGAASGLAVTSLTLILAAAHLLI